MNKRSQRFTATIGALLMAGALAMTGCGSSGGDSSPASTTPATGSVTYSGTTTQAALDTTSGATVSTAATTNISEVSATASSFSLSPSLMKGAPGIQPIAEAASMMEAASFQAPTSTAGNCPTNPGTMVSDSNPPAYSVTYNQYCTGEGTTNYYTINGSYSISGTKGNYTVTADKLTISFVNGTSTYSAEYGGKITAVTSGDVTTTTINYAYNVSGTAMTAYSFKLENFVKKDTKNTTTMTTEYSGRFYYGASGYVDITTPTALTGTLGTNGYVNMYTAGTIRFTGSGGNYYEITYQSGGKTTSNLNGTSAPTVTSFTPTSGAVGTTVTITGTNFNTTLANNTVKFNGTQATVSAATATSITVTVPTGATTGTVTVTTAGGTATSSSSFTVTTSSTAAPTITSFTPNTGAAGTSVTITGTNLTSVTEVLFTGPATSTAFASGAITAHTATSITATAPASLAAGGYTISVIYPGNELAAVGTFTVTVAGTGTNAALVGTWKFMTYKDNATGIVTDMSPYNMIEVWAANGDWTFTQPTAVVGVTCQQSGTSTSTATTITSTTVSDPCSVPSMAGTVQTDTYTIVGSTLTANNSTGIFTFQKQ